MKTKYRYGIMALSIMTILILTAHTAAVADEYDNIMMTHNTELAERMAENTRNTKGFMGGELSQLYGVWAAPDGGKWYFDNNGIMGDAGRHRGKGFTFYNGILTFTGGSAPESYYIYFASDYQQLFLFELGTAKCALALSRVLSVSGGTNDLSRSVPDIPRGSLDETGVGYGFVLTSGWMYDPNTPNISSTYYVSIGNVYGLGELHGPYTANLVREDISTNHGVGRYHGYAATAYTELTGNQEVYIYTTDYPSNSIVQMAHTRVNIPVGYYTGGNGIRDISGAADFYGTQTTGSCDPGYGGVSIENAYTPEEASDIMYEYCADQVAMSGISYISEEYAEDEHTYVVWWRSYTGFTVQYRVDLISGDVIECGPYNGRTPDSQLPFSMEYSFNLSDYEYYDDYEDD